MVYGSRQAGEKAISRLSMCGIGMGIRQTPAFCNLRGSFGLVLQKKGDCWSWFENENRGEEKCHLNVLHGLPPGPVPMDDLQSLQRGDCRT